MKKCNYCISFFEDEDQEFLLRMDISNFPQLDAALYIDDDGKLRLEVTDACGGLSTREKINYCPICGKRLERTKNNGRETDVYNKDH